MTQSNIATPIDTPKNISPIKVEKESFENIEPDVTLSLDNIGLFKRVNRLLQSKPPEIKEINEDMPKNEIINQYCKLSSILQYLFIGKEPKEPSPLTEENNESETIATDNAIHELLLNPPKWNDFIEGLQVSYPLKHKIHKTKRAEIEKKLALDRDRQINKELSLHKPSTIYNWPQET